MKAQIEARDRELDNPFCKDAQIMGIQNARRYYNAVVRDFNTKIAQFPSNLVAGTLGFRPREFFGLSDRSEQTPPDVDLGAGT